MSLWTEKYRITSESELYGYNSHVAKIKTWLFEFKKCKPNMKRALLLVGTPGTGKTSIAKLILTKFGYKVLHHNASNTYGIEKAYTIIKYGAKGIKFMDDYEGNTYGVILDEIEGLPGAKDKGIKELIKMVNPNGARRKIETYKITEHTSPVIFIANDNRNTKVKSLSKICEVIEFQQPEKSTMHGFVKLINKKEKIGLTPLETFELSSNIAPDFRTVLLFLQYLKNLITNTTTTIKDVDVIKCMDQFENKEHDNKLTDRVRNLFKRNISLENTWNEYTREKSMITMVMHENYPVWISDWKSRLRVIDQLVVGDMIDKVMYNSQKWAYRDIHSAVVVHNVMKEKQTVDGEIGVVPLVRNQVVLRRFSEIKSKRDKRNAQLFLEMMLDNDCDSETPEGEIIN